MPHHLLRHDHSQEVQITCLEVLVPPSHQRLVCIFWHHVPSPSPWSFLHPLPGPLSILPRASRGAKRRKSQIQTGAERSVPCPGAHPRGGNVVVSTPKRRLTLKCQVGQTIIATADVT